MNSQTFSAEVRAQLARRQLTVSDLAQALEVSAQTVYRRIYHGAAWPLDEAIAAARFFNVPLVTMLGSHQSDAA